MTRSTILATSCMLLVGCGSPTVVGVAENSATANTTTVEDVSSDSLAAPADMPLDSESKGVGNAE